MKKNLILFLFLLFILNIHSQDIQSQNSSSEEIKSIPSSPEETKPVSPTTTENIDPGNKEDSLTKETDTKKPQVDEESKKQETQKKWFFKVNGAYGLSNSEFGNGTTEQFGLGLDYRANPKFSFGISLNSAMITQKERDNSERNSIILLSLLSSPSQPSNTNQGNSPINNSLIVAATLATPLVLYYRYSTVNLDFNYHPRGDSFFDPFMGVGAFGGVCTAPVPCMILGMNLNLGIQLNWERFFVISQIQGQFYQIREPEIDPFNQRNSILLLSAGVRF
jgi:hypothetical protein